MKSELFVDPEPEAHPPTGALDGVPPGVVHELRSLYSPQYLSARAADIAELLRHAPGFEGVAALELGAHRGAFLEGMARQWKPELVAGLEWRPRYVRLANERLRRKSLDNARMLRCDAKLALPLLIRPETLDAVFVTFPDPWWKKRHAHRRLLEPLFLRIIARRLRPGGRLYLKSDVFDYLHRVRQFAEISQAFRPLPPEKWPDEGDWTLTTRERKCMRAAIPFGRGYYERDRNFDAALPEAPERPEAFAVDEELAPEAVIRGAPPSDVAEKALQRARRLAAREREGPGDR